MGMNNHKLKKLKREKNQSRHMVNVCPRCGNVVPKRNNITCKYCGLVVTRENAIKELWKNVES